MKQKSHLTSIKIALLLALLTFLIRFVYVFNFLAPHDYIKWLPYQNHRRAIAVLEKGGAFYGNAWGVYYLILAGEYRLYRWLGISDTTTITVIIHIVLASVSIFFFYLLAVRVVGARMGLISSLLLMLYYPAVYLNAQLVSENLFLPLVIISFYLLIPPPKSAERYLVAGSLLAVAAAIRPIFLSFLPMAVGWLVLTSFKTKVRRKWLAPLLLSVAITSILLIFMALNQRFSHQHLFQLTGSTGVNVAIAQCNIKKIEYRLENGENYWISPPMHWETDFEKINTTIPFYNQAYYFNMGWRCIRENPGQLIKDFTHIKNIFDGKFYPEFKPTETHQIMMRFWKIVVGVSLVLFLLYPIWANQKERQIYWLLLLLLFSLFLSVYVANPGEERYIVPYSWIFFLMAPKMMKLGLLRKAT